MNFRQAILVAVISFFTVATTYVVKEQGREVARWTDQDGRDDVREVAAEDLPGGPPPHAVKPAAVNTPPDTEILPTYEWFYGKNGYEKAVQEIKSTNKPMLLYFHATWCPFVENALFPHQYSHFSCLTGRRFSSSRWNCHLGMN